MSSRISVSEIAQEVGTSERVLQQAFKEFKHATPSIFLRTIRLERVRKDLMEAAGPPTIAEIARDRGFSHLGRFAALYRQAYGETPSETAKRAEGALRKTPKKRCG